MNGGYGQGCTDPRDLLLVKYFGSNHSDSHSRGLGASLTMNRSVVEKLQHFESMKESLHLLFHVLTSRRYTEHCLKSSLYPKVFPPNGF